MTNHRSQMTNWGRVPIRYLAQQKANSRKKLSRPRTIGELNGRPLGEGGRRKRRKKIPL
jgi:hypothetical protein